MATVFEALGDFFLLGQTTTLVESSPPHTNFQKWNLASPFFSDWLFFTNKEKKLQTLNYDVGEGLSFIWDYKQVLTVGGNHSHVIGWP